MFSQINQGNVVFGACYILSEVYHRKFIKITRVSSMLPKCYVDFMNINLHSCFLVCLGLVKHLQITINIQRLMTV